MVAITRLALPVGATIVLAVALHDLGGLDGPLTTVRDFLFVALTLLAVLVVGARATRGENRRFGWAMVALGLLLWDVGYIAYYTSGPGRLVDITWLAGYPFIYLGVGMLILRRLPRLISPLALDGLAGGLAFAAVAAAVLAPVAVIESGASWDAIAAMTYPLIDTVLLALSGTLLAIDGGRTSRGWLVLVGGAALMAGADILYAHQSLEGTYIPRGVADVGWAIFAFATTIAAHRPEEEATVRRLTSAWVHVAPFIALVASVGVLLYGAVERVDGIALTLATLALGLSAIRAVLTVRLLSDLASAREASMTDDLTALPNRRRVHGVLTRRLLRVTRDRPLALLIIDLDGFKELNDSLGHDAGDAVLIEVAQRLRHVVRPDDLVGRLGGDEFAVVLEGTGEHAAEEVVARLREAVSRPVSVHGIHVHVSASVGIGIAPLHGRRHNDLMRRADAAMYQAKRDRTGHAFFDAGDEAGALERLRLAGDIRRALEAGEFVIHFQPKADMRTGRIVGVEALARWEHPERGLLSPAAFLPALEQTDLAPEFTRAMLRQAVEHAARWREQGCPLPVAVNLTALDLRNESLPEQVADLLDGSGALPADIGLEVTETGLLTDPDRADRIITRLRDLGMTVDLDDFGTGWSSLTHLQRLHVDRIKIDRSFVGRMENDAAAAAIVESTIGLAHALGLEVIAEGVEDEDCWQHLRRLGCDQAQGYLLSPPVAAAALWERIAALETDLLGLAAA